MKILWPVDCPAIIRGFARYNDILFESLLRFKSLVQCFLCLHGYLLVVKSTYLNSNWMIWANYTHFVPFSFGLGQPAPPFLMIGAPYSLKQWQPLMLWLLYVPPCFLHSTQCFSVQPTFLGFLGMRESSDSILHFCSAPFALVVLAGFTSSSTLFSIDLSQGH